MLKQQRLAGVRLRLFGGELDVDHAADDVADELAIHAVIGDEAEGVGVHLVDLGEVVDDHARNQQARVQLGIDGHDRVGRAEHRGGVVEQAAALGVVHLLGGGEGQQLVARTVEQLAGDPAQIRVGDMIRRADDLAEHLVRVARGAGDEGGHIHRIAVFGGANLFHAKLHAAVELVARGAHLDDAARQRRLNGAIPHLRVDRAGFIGQRHIQIVFAVGAGALLGGADDQVALEAVVALDIRQIHIKTPSCVNDIMNDTGGVCKEKFRIAENMEKTGYEILYYPFGRGRGGGG